MSSVFGAPQSPFGAGSAPGLFGSMPALGAFGAQTTSSLFGAPQSGGGLFGMPAASSGGLFGAPSPVPSLFGAASSTGLFGSAPTTGGLFGAAASSASLFGATAGSPFGTASSGMGLFGPSTPSMFGSATPAGVGLFGAAAPGTLFPPSAGALVPAQPAPQQAGGQQLIIGKDQQPVGRKTAFENLPDQMQQFMQQRQRATLQTQIEDKVRRHRNEAASLENRMALHESVAQHRAMNEEASRLNEALRQVQAWLESDSSAADSFKDKVIQVVKGTEQTAFLLRVNRARRDHMIMQSMGQQQQQQQQHQVAVNSELLNASTQLPSPYLKTAIAAFEDQLKLLRDMLSSLEALVPLDGPVSRSSASPGEQLPEILRNVHEYFIHVAACLARAELRLSNVRAAFLSWRQAQGDFYDPFADADERAARAAAKMAAVPKLSAGAPGGSWSGNTDGAAAGAAANATAAAGSAAPGAGPSAFGAAGGVGLFGGSGQPGSSVFGSASPSGLFGSTTGFGLGTTLSQAPASGVRRM